MNAGIGIGNGYTHFDRRLVGIPRDPQQPAHSLGYIVIGGFMAERPRLAESGNGGIDDVRPYLPGFFIGQAQFFHRPGRKIFDDNVTLFHQAEGDFFPFRGFQIQGNTVFIAVQVSKIPAFVVFKRQVMARIIAASRPFHLNDPGTQISKEHGAVRAGIYMRKI